MYDLSNYLSYLIFRYLHIVFGILCLIAGLLSFFLRKHYLHRKIGLIYFITAQLTCLGSLVTSSIRIEKNHMFIPISATTMLLVGLGYIAGLSTKPEMKWWHVVLMLSSYNFLITGLLVQFHYRLPILRNFPILVSWILPGIFIVPLIFYIIRKFPHKSNPFGFD